MSNMKMLVSVIVPVYNVEAYLEKCLRSIMNQSYENLEIIVVNDGTEDNSEEIILRLANVDSRIKYIKKVNGGLSSARNMGIDIASGRYISFVDSDDWVHQDFIKKLVEAIEKNEADISICNMQYVYSDGRKKNRTPYIDKNETVSNITALKDLFNGRKFKFHAQNKMYKSELFVDGSVRFPLGKIYEDVFTTYKLVYRASKISYINSYTYYYLQNRPGSILYTRFNTKRFDVLEALDDIQTFLKINNIEIREEFEHLVVINIISLVNYICPIYKNLSKWEQKGYSDLIQNTKVRYLLYNVLTNSSINKIEKIRYWLIMHYFPQYVKVINFIKNHNNSGRFL